MAIRVANPAGSTRARLALDKQHSEQDDDDEDARTRGRDDAMCATSITHWSASEA